MAFMQCALLFCTAAAANAPSGKAATCLALEPGGGLGFNCKGCDKPGLQPFSGVKAVDFWIRDNPASLKAFIYK